MASPVKSTEATPRLLPRILMRPSGIADCRNEKEEQKWIIDECLQHGRYFPLFQSKPDVPPWHGSAGLGNPIVQIHLATG